jgi:serine/threonine-protein kinase RsbW
MPADLDLTLPATTRGLRQALESLEAVCAARRVEADLISRAAIVVEELFTNTIKYGYGGEGDQPVRLALQLADDVQLTYEDDAPHFDPTRWALASGTPAGELPVGRAGIPLVMRLSLSVAYQPLSASAGNRIVIVLARQSRG